MTARLFSSVHAAVTECAALLHWWGTELRDLMSWLSSRAGLSNTQPLRLVMNEHSVTVPGAVPLCLPLQDSSVDVPSAIAAAGLPPRAKARVVLPAAEVLICSLRMPALRESDLAAAIELQLERELPLSRDQVYLDWRAEPEVAGQQIAVRVAIARRSTIDSLIAALRSWNWELCSVEAHSGEEWGLLPKRASTLDLSMGLRERWLLALGVLLGVLHLMVVAGQWAYERTSLEDELDLARQSSMQFEAQRQFLTHESEPILALQRIMAQADAAQILQSITQAVPLDTWLYRTQISVSAERTAALELNGYAPSPTALVEVLEQHPQFEAVELVAAGASADVGSLTRVELKAQWRQDGSTGAPR